MFKNLDDLKIKMKQVTDNAKKVVMENIDDETKEKIKEQINNVKDVVKEEKDKVKEKIDDIKEKYVENSDKEEQKEDTNESVENNNNYSNYYGFYYREDDRKIDSETEDIDDEVLYGEFFEDDVEDTNDKNNFFEGIFNNMQEDKKEIINNIINKGKNAIRKSKEFINDKIEYIKGTFYFDDTDDLVNNLNDIEDEYVKDFESEESKNIFTKLYDGLDENTKNKIEKFLNGTKETVINTIDHFKNKIEKAKKRHARVKKVKETYKNCKDKTKEATKTVVSKTKEVATTVKDKAENAKDKVAEYTGLEKEDQKIVNERLLNIGKNVSKEFLQNMKEFALKLKEEGVNVSTDISTLYNDIKNDNLKTYKFAEVLNEYQSLVSSINELAYSLDEINSSKLEDMINKAIEKYYELSLEYQKLSEPEKKSILWVINSNTKLLRESIYEYKGKVYNRDLLKEDFDNKENIIDSYIADAYGTSCIFEKESFCIDNGYEYILTDEGHTKRVKSYLSGFIYTNLEYGLKAINLTHNKTKSVNVWLTKGDYEINGKLHIVNCELDNVKGCFDALYDMRNNKLEMDPIIDILATDKELEEVINYYNKNNQKIKY